MQNDYKKYYKPLASKPEDYKDFSKYKLGDAKKCKKIFKLKDLNMLFYGCSGIGKTELGLAFENAVMIPVEKSSINKKEFFTIFSDQDTLCDSWECFYTVINHIEEQKKNGNWKHDFIIIDTIDALFQLCRQYIQKKLGVNHEADKGQSGYVKVNDEFKKQIIRLSSLTPLIILAHYRNRAEDENPLAYKIRPHVGDSVMNMLDSIVSITGVILTDQATNRRVVKFRGRSNDFCAKDHTGILGGSMDYDTPQQFYRDFKAKFENHNKQNQFKKEELKND